MSAEPQWPDQSSLSPLQVPLEPERVASAPVTTVTGTSVVTSLAQVYCLGCGTMYIDDSPFCRNCGMQRPVVYEAPPPSPSPTQYSLPPSLPRVQHSPPPQYTEPSLILYSPPPQHTEPPPIARQPPPPMTVKTMDNDYEQPIVSKAKKWHFNLCHPCTPIQCCCGMFCPWVMTLEMIAYAAPFELQGFGCIVTRESAVLLTVVAWFSWFSSFGLFFLLIMLSIAAGIKKKLLIKESMLQTTCKICCCWSCFQIQLLRQCEYVTTTVGMPIGVIQLDAY